MTTAQVVGEYTLLAKIGEGGMGVVHLARKGDGPRVALKVLRPHIVGDDEARQRLAREVSSLERVRSRWVAEVVDADPWAPVPYIATRYVPGLSLHDHVHQEGPITGHDLLWFAACLAEGVLSVHEVGVLHRDVKPSNVLMEGRTPILIDFGLARVADDPKLTHTGWLLGTPGYLAPEILYGDDASPASDLHSWAATVAFAALGRPPFGRGPSMAIMDRVRRGEHDLDGLEGPLRDVVAAALDPEPQQRPPLEAILAWLRPQTTRPSPLLAAPPVAASVDDPFTLPLALAAQAGAPPAVPPAGSDSDLDRSWREALDLAAAPTVGEPPLGEPTAARSEPADPPRGEHGTLVMPAAPTLREPVPPHAPPPPPPVAPRAPSPVVAAPPAWEHPPPASSYPPPRDHHLVDEHPAPAARPPLGERARRVGLVLAGSLVVGGALAAAPWVTLVLVCLGVWLLRSGSLAASTAAARRLERGRKWYDGALLVVQSPWRVLQSLPATLMLLLWSAGLATAAGLLGYAVSASVEAVLAVAGVVLALSVWWGPGSRRVRSPLGRVVDPLSRTAGTWLLALVLVLGLAAALGAWVGAEGASWTPASDRPFGG